DRLAPVRGRAGARPRHPPRLAEYDLGLAGGAEDPGKLSPPPRVVAVDHDDVIEPRRFDAAAVRPSEAHVPLVDEQPDMREAAEVRRDQLARSVRAPIVDDEDFMGDAERLERTGDALARLQKVFALAVRRDHYRQGPL